MQRRPGTDGPRPARVHELNRRFSQACYSCEATVRLTVGQPYSYCDARPDMDPAFRQTTPRLTFAAPRAYASYVL